MSSNSKLPLAGAIHINYRISACINVTQIEAPGASSGGGTKSDTVVRKKFKQVPIQNTLLTHLEVKVKGGNSGKFASFHQIFPNFLHNCPHFIGLVPNLEHLVPNLDQYS